MTFGDLAQFGGYCTPHWVHGLAWLAKKDTMYRNSTPLILPFVLINEAFEALGAAIFTYF